MLVGLVEVVTGLRLDTPPPNSLLLDDSEVPDGLVPTAVEGSTPVQPGFAVRVWRSEDVKLSIVAGLTSSPNSAAAALREVPDYFRSQGLHPIPLPQVEGGGAATGTIAVDGEQQQVSGAFFARGKVLFLVTAAVMDSDSATASFDLVTDVAVQQASKAGQLYTSTPSTTLNIAYSVGGLLGSVLGIFFVFGLWAYVRDPLRKKRRGKQSGEPVVATVPGQAVDVSRESKKSKRWALTVFVAQFLGAALVLGAILPSLDLIHRLGLVTCGGLLYVGGLWYRSRRTRSGRRSAFGGQRPFRGLVLFCLATLLAMAGVVCLLVAVISGPDSPGASSYTNATLCLLAAAGICSRTGRRFTAISAERLLRRDPRPMVLYLRSFGDDSIRLRTATLGRRSLIERFTPSRFDSFEEVLVRHLAAIGPVVAINPPGTKLAPLGAARETMPQDSWQAAVDNWIERSVLVVIGAPPGVWSPGLVWELQQVTDRGRWPGTLVVVPPLPDQQVRARFAAFSAAGGERWPFRSALPTDPARVLALTRRNDEWVAITANHRTEWTCAAAVAAAERLVHADSPARAQVTVET